MDSSGPLLRLRQALSTRSATVGICGLGYVGLPLSAAAAEAGYPVIGFDIDTTKPERLNKGESYVDTVDSDVISKLVLTGRFRATSDFGQLSGCDVVVICVPTPLTRQREPDLSFVEDTARTIADRLRPGQMIILESTTYPGTTLNVVKPILERSGLRSRVDFVLGFSPEREDPGNALFKTRAIPKVVSGDGAEALDLVGLFYAAIVEKIVSVSSPDVAEAVKITENVFRAVNIALVNELKIIFAAMGIDIWEVIDAAKSKPFGYMPFYPGPGLGGHCIPIDPFYLTWKSREYDLTTRFIELAGEINRAMPRYVVQILERELGSRFALALCGARILVLGLAYKRDVADVRESPSLKLIELLEERKACVDFHDLLVPMIPPTREYAGMAGRVSVDIDPSSLAGYDAILIATDHSTVDYALVSRHSKLIIDTRNAIAARGLDTSNVVKA